MIANGGSLETQTRFDLVLVLAFCVSGFRSIVASRIRRESLQASARTRNHRGIRQPAFDPERRVGHAEHPPKRGSGLADARKARRQNPLARKRRSAAGNLRRDQCAGRDAHADLYAHYDGQPIEPAKWTGGDPFKPTLRSASLEAGGKDIPFPSRGQKFDPEWRLYARSTGDDKAPIIAICAALDAMREKGIAPASNIKFFFEGEEEAGSPHLEKIVENTVTC